MPRALRVEAGLEEPADDVAGDVTPTRPAVRVAR